MAENMDEQIFMISTACAEINQHIAEKQVGNTFKLKFE